MRTRLNITRLLLAVLVVTMILPARPTRAGDVHFMANDVEFLNLMGQLEAPRGFGTVSDFAPISPERALYTLTLAEVLAYQREIRALGAISSAVGRYQFIYVTLRDLAARYEISDQLVFDAEVQTYLARVLMHDCGFYERDTSVPQLGNCLAGVWAALPIVNGSQAGKSAYAADGVNKALVSPEVVLGILSRRFDW
jgi:hypothetical protein